MLHTHHASISQYSLKISSLAEYERFFFIPKISTSNPFVLTGKDTEAQRLHLSAELSKWRSGRPQVQPRAPSINHRRAECPGPPGMKGLPKATGWVTCVPPSAVPQAEGQSPPGTSSRPHPDHRPQNGG